MADAEGAWNPSSLLGLLGLAGGGGGSGGLLSAVGSGAAKDYLVGLVSMVT